MSCVGVGVRRAHHVLCMFHVAMYITKGGWNGPSGSVSSSQ